MTKKINGAHNVFLMKTPSHQLSIAEFPMKAVIAMKVHFKRFTTYMFSIVLTKVNLL